MKTGIKLITIVFLIVLASSSCFALGVVPSRKIVKFDSDIDGLFKITAINNEKKDVNLKVYARGRFANYVSIEQDLIHLTNKQESAAIKYSIDVPYSIRIPGDNLIEIVIEEIPESPMQKTTIAGNVAVVHQLVLRSPKEGKFVDVMFFANNPGLNDEALFTYTFSNIGSEDIKNIRAEVEVFDSNLESVAKSSYSFNQLNAGETRKETRLLGTKLSPDNYKVVTKIYFDDIKIEKETAFYVVGPQIDIIGIDIVNFNLGGINRIDFYAYNSWKDEIKDVYADVYVKDSSGIIVSSFKTYTINAKPFADNVLTGHWNTKGLSTGDYAFMVALSYAGKIEEREFKISVFEDQVIVSQPITGGAVTKTGRGNSIVSLLVLIFIALVILNIALIIYIKRKNPPILPQTLYSIILFNAVISGLLFKIFDWIRMI